MKISHWLLIFLLFFGGVTLALLLGDVPDQSTGMVHEQFKTMAHSGARVVDAEEVKWLAYLFGIGVIGVFGFAVSFGAKRREQLKEIKPWLIIGVVAYLLVYTLLTLNYWDYAIEGNDKIIGGLPAPTALMLYGLGMIPLIISLVYIIKFRDWVLTEEDEIRFQEIIARRAKEQG